MLTALGVKARTMLKLIWDLMLDEVIPIAGGWTAEKVMRKTMKAISEAEVLPSNLQAQTELPLEVLVEYHERERRRKAIVEEKAKTNTLSVTVAVVILSASLGLARDINSLWASKTLGNILMTMLALALLSFLQAGLCSVRALRVDQFFDVGLSVEVQVRGDDEGRRSVIAECIALNMLMTNIRSNYAEASYVGLRNGILLTSIATILLVQGLISA